MADAKISAAGGRARAYHHGELRQALIAAADAILSESGVAGFSLRDAARRAGVSPGAPAHHFGNASGLLTEVAVLGYADLKGYLDRARQDGTPSERLRALATQYVLFALEQRGRFGLMFRKDLINRADEGYRTASEVALMRFAGAAGARAGVSVAEMQARGDFSAVIAAWATAHGIAHLALEEKLQSLLDPADPQRDFVERLLPDIVRAQWPDAGDR